MRGVRIVGRYVVYVHASRGKVHQGVVYMKGKRKRAAWKPFRHLKVERMTRIFDGSSKVVRLMP